MADATTPVLLHPRATLSTNIGKIGDQDFRGRKFAKMAKLNTDLTEALIDDVETYKDEDATIDTAAVTGEFFIDLTAEIVTAVKKAIVDSLSLDLGIVPYKIGDFYVLTGVVAGFNLTRFEELTMDDSGATLQLSFAADLTIGAARVIVCRLTTGAISAADAVATGGGSGGTLTFTAGAINQVGGANNRCPGIGGRLKTVSTGVVLASATSSPVSYIVEGTKVTA